VVRREEESRTHYEHVVEHSSDGIFEVDLDGRVIFANASLAVILGRSLEDLTGAALSDVLAPLEGANVLERLTVDSDERDRTELAVSRPDGVRRVLEVSTSARREGGVAAGFQGVVRDVTAERDLEESKNEFLALITASSAWASPSAARPNASRVSPTTCSTSAASRPGRSSSTCGLSNWA